MSPTDLQRIPGNDEGALEPAVERVQLLVGVGAVTNVLEDVKPGRPGEEARKEAVVFLLN
jgi:hypothetical protein